MREEMKRFLGIVLLSVLILNLLVTTLPWGVSAYTPQQPPYENVYTGFGTYENGLVKDIQADAIADKNTGYGYSRAAATAWIGGGIASASHSFSNRFIAQSSQECDITWKVRMTSIGDIKRVDPLILGAGARTHAYIILTIIDTSNNEVIKQSSIPIFSFQDPDHLSLTYLYEKIFESGLENAVGEIIGIVYPELSFIKYVVEGIKKGSALLTVFEPVREEIVGEYREYNIKAFLTSGKEYQWVFTIETDARAVAISTGSAGALAYVATELNSVEIKPVELSPSSISLAVTPSSITINEKATLSGTISSPTLGDLSGTVYLQYSKDNGPWNNFGSTSSSPTGTYSYPWIPPSQGTYRIQSSWNGNNYYSDSTSNIVTLTVTDVQLTDFSISAVPTSLDFIQPTSGSTSQTCVLTVSSINGWVWPIDLSGSWVGYAPNDISYQFDPTSVTPSGESKTSTLTVTVNKNQYVGEYTLRVSGRSGLIEHSKDIKISVEPPPPTAETWPRGGPSPPFNFVVPQNYYRGCSNGYDPVTSGGQGFWVVGSELSRESLTDISSSIYYINPYSDRWVTIVIWNQNGDNQQQVNIAPAGTPNGYDRAWIGESGVTMKRLDIYASKIWWGFPSSASATASSNQIALSWDSNTNGAESGFRIERRIDPSQNWVEIGNVDRTITTYHDTGLSPGTYHYRIRAYSSDYNSYTEYSNEPSAVVPDTTPPSTPNPDDGVTGWSNDNTPTFTWPASSSGNGITGYYYWVDNGPQTWTTLTNVTLTPQADGSHTFYVKAVDNLGNPSNDGSHVFLIDTTPPSVTISSPTEGENTQSSNVTMTWSGSDENSGVNYYKVKIDEENWINKGVSTSHTFTGLNDGSHTLYVYAEDYTSNNWIYTVNINIDHIPPVVVITSPDDGAVYKPSAVPAATYTVDDPTATIVEFGYSTSKGEHTYTVTATDMAGNVGLVSVKYTVESVPIARAMNVSFYSGWNLISIPGRVNDSRIETILDNLQNIEVIYGYEDGEWRYWIPGIPSTLNALEAGHGYWILFDAEYNVTFTSYQTDPEPLHQGWNLIGITNGTEQNVESYLDGAAWHSVFGYDSSTHDWRYNIQGLGGPLTTLKPGVGYWVYIGN